MQFISAIISPKDLLLLNPENYILIDASAGARSRYNNNHLAGALFVDVNEDLAHIDDFTKGGRHPLPTLEQFSITLGKLGISQESHVVVYDDKNGSNAAARFWWMLKSIGHHKIQVLDGGYQIAMQSGFPTSSKINKSKTATLYPIHKWLLPLSKIKEVEEVSKKDNYLVIDVRDANRYAGLTEPIDLIAGHIPGAVNIPFTENLDENGNFLAPHILKEKYTKALSGIKPENVIVHCGSGITACHTLLAMDYADLQIPKLYVGSWSEWSRNSMDMVLA